MKGAQRTRDSKTRRESIFLKHKFSTTQSIAHNTGDFILWIALQYTRPRIAKIHYKNTRPKI
jgi:hypothetical protein